MIFIHANESEHVVFLNAHWLTGAMKNNTSELLKRRRKDFIFISVAGIFAAGKYASA